MGTIVITESLIYAILDSWVMSSLERVCHELKYSDAYRNYFALDSSDNIIIAVFIAISILCALFNLLFFCKLPNARQPPFDILFLLSLMALLVDAVYIATMGIPVLMELVYDSAHPILALNQKVPPDFDSFCQATGSIRFLTEMVATTYNLIFCFYYTFKVKNPLRSWAKEHKEVHILCIIIASISTIIVYLADEIGVSVLGVCGLKVSKGSFFIELAISIMYTIVLVLSSVFFLKYLKKIGKFDPKARSFFKYFLVYTILVSANYLLQSISISVLTVDCYTGLSHLVHSLFVKLANILNLSLSLVVTIVICFHPQLRRSLVPAILRSFRKRRQSNSISQKLNRTTIRQVEGAPNRSTSFYDDLITEFSYNNANHTIYDINLADLNSLNKDYLSDIKESNRISLLSTILGYLSLQSSDQNTLGHLKNRSTLSLFLDTSSRMSEERYDQPERESIKNNAHELLSWNMWDKTETYICKQLTSENREHFCEEAGIMEMKMICYCPEVFEELRRLDGLESFEKSMNPGLNLQKIYQNSQADGGSSGQFFYFTEDNRFIIKTITKKELAVLLCRIEAYFRHFQYHTDSLVVKLYGVYTGVNSETRQQIHFIIMGNLQHRISKSDIIRIYDLKGSKHRREVLNETEMVEVLSYSTDSERHPEVILTQKTLKDIDFHRIEQHIWLSREDTSRVKSTLKSDSQFFASNGLIDYSLIVMKVRTNSGRVEGQRAMFASTKEKGVSYILGIIDYLETWNMRKKGEKWYKSIFTQSSEISSQSPEFYCQRFYSELVDKIFQPN